MVILSLNTIDSSEAYKQIPIYRADNSVKSHTFLLFLSAFAHLFTVLSHKRTNFCLPDKSSFFCHFGRFWGKITLNQGKIRKITRSSGHRDCRNVIFMPASTQKAHYFLPFFAQIKNDNFLPLPLYIIHKLCYT